MYLRYGCVRFLGQKIFLGGALKVTIKILLIITNDGIWWGATWFLGSLFLVSVLYKVVDKLNSRKWANLCVFLFFSLFGYYFNNEFSRTMILSLFYAIGNVL